MSENLLNDGINVNDEAVKAEPKKRKRATPKVVEKPEEKPAGDGAEVNTSKEN